MQSVYQDELSKLNKLKTSTAGGLNIPFREFAHKSVLLYTHLNKKMGPFSLENAEQIMLRFSAKGFDLFVNTPRTKEQIEEYKKTDKFKEEHEKWKRQRKMRQLASKKTTPEDIAKAVALETAKVMGAEIAKAQVKANK